MRAANTAADFGSGPRKTAPSQSLPTGTVLEQRYEIVRFLDCGATASVYLAVDLSADRAVVAKVLEPSAARNPLLRSRFADGARAAMRVVHPNVVEVLNISDASDPPYAVMEALVGETLGALIARTGCIDVPCGLDLVRQAAAGLGALHCAGLVHRDVKPDNLFLVGPSERPRSLKVLDFGHVHLIPSGAELAPEEIDTVLGTAQYMAPEQVVGDPVDARTDVYALGVVMFRMFTGHLPFDLDLGLDLLRHQLASPAPPPSWLDDDIDPGLEAVILKAMRKNPRNRQQSMAELVSELDGVRLRTTTRQPQTLDVLDLYAPQSPRAVRAVSLLKAAGF